MRTVIEQKLETEKMIEMDKIIEEELKMGVI
jgi:hypothetical protein